MIEKILTSILLFLMSVYVIGGVWLIIKVHQDQRQRPSAKYTLTTSPVTFETGDVEWSVFTSCSQRKGE